MFFITTGTTSQPFLRMDHLVDQLTKLRPDELFIYQNPVSNLKNKKNLLVFRELSFERFVFLIKKAKVVISHAGPASIACIFQYSSVKPIVIPRLKKYKEHVNNHQLYFSLSQKEIINFNVIDQKSIRLINKILSKPIARTFNEITSNNDFATNFEAYIDKYLSSR